ncbi:MAG TPA: S9 family peptidase [Melioribacteraceae bacterium]|mgnify:CR=1 FL=1|nr:S9 family peptidase [Melioribacteraceae bacterium]
MKNILLIIIIIFVSSCTHTNKDDIPPLIPVKTFFSNSEKLEFRISPDGKYISYLKPHKNILNVFIKEIETNEEKQVTFSLNKDIDVYFWKGNNNLIYVQDNTGNQNYHIYNVNIKTKKSLDLTPYKDVRSYVIDFLRDDNDNIIVQMNKNNIHLFDVYKVNINTGKADVICNNPGNYTRWLTDHNGELRIAVATDGVNSSILYRENELDSFRVILTTNFKEVFKPLLFSKDNSQLYALSNINRDKIALIEYNLKTNKEQKVIYEDESYDVKGFIYSQAKLNLIAVWYITWKSEYYFLDEDKKLLYNEICKQLPGYQVQFEDNDDNENNYIFRIYNDKNPGEYYLYNIYSKKLVRLNEINPKLKETDLCNVKPIKFRSRDGLIIPGYLTMPKGNKQDKFPTVVIPHAGPWWRDEWEFNPTVQFLANRGYAVLQLNYRGSIGYGKEFWSAGFKQWGKKMQDDITDGVKWLIDEGITDKKRVAIYGESYGGYAAMAGLSFTPDLFAAGISYCGFTNLFTYIESYPPYWKPFLEMLNEKIGDPHKDSLYLYQVSPYYHIKNIKSPLLIAQGGNDTKSNKNEFNGIVNTLKAKGVDVTPVYKENEGQGFSNEQNIFDFYLTVEKFLEKYLK